MKSNEFMNHVIMEDPANAGPFFDEVDENVIYRLHNVTVPSVDVLRFQNQALSNAYRKKAKLTLKLGPDCHIDSQQYKENDFLVTSYYEFNAGPLRHIRRLITMRKQAYAYKDKILGLNEHAREFIACKENYVSSLVKLKCETRNVYHYLGLHKEPSKPMFTPTTWVDPLKRISGQTCKDLFGPVRTQKRLDEIASIIRENPGTSFETASWVYVRSLIHHLRLRDLSRTKFVIGQTYYCVENARSLEKKGFSNVKIPSDLQRGISDPLSDHFARDIRDAEQLSSAKAEEILSLFREENSLRMVDADIGSIEQVRELVTSYDKRAAATMLFKLRSEGVNVDALFEGDKPSFNSFPREWLTSSDLDVSDIRQISYDLVTKHASLIKSVNPDLPIQDCYWMVIEIFAKRSYAKHSESEDNLVADYVSNLTLMALKSLEKDHGVKDDPPFKILLLGTPKSIRKYMVDMTQ